MRPMPAESNFLTLDQFAAMPADPYWREEASHGQIVREPPPSHLHGTLVVRLTVLLARYLEGSPVAELCCNSGFLLAREPLTVRAPDLALVRAERLTARHASSTFFEGAPDLAIEVISPANSASDIQEKVEQYLEAGASSVWVVYPKTRSVAVHRTGGEMRLLHSDAVLTEPSVLPGFEMRIESIWP